ncbi:hypothetical protein JL722_5839 [Aureococcus anophagefferens]|nr:hypothetical protein JL722_5839 [Aureococcus anophagefferens]
MRFYGGDGNDNITMVTSRANSPGFTPFAGTVKTVDGGDGNDTITVLGDENEGIFGGRGDDTIYIAGWVETDYDGSNGQIIQGSAVHFVYDGDGDDVIEANSFCASAFHGDAGDDKIYVQGEYAGMNYCGSGGQYMNAAYGGIFGDDGDDSISVVGDYMANLHGGEGDDTIHVDGYFSPSYMNTFNGGGGTDTLCAMTDGVSDPHDYWDPGFGGAGWSNQAAGEFEIIDFTNIAPSGAGDDDCYWQNFQHYCHTYDGTDWKFYFNGALAHTETVALDTGSDNPLTLGVRYSSGYSGYFSGKIDDVYVYSSALNAASIEVLYNEVAR